MDQEIFMQAGPAVYHIVTEEELQIEEHCRQFFFENLSDIPSDIRKGSVITCRIYRTAEFAPVQGKLVYEDLQHQIFQNAQTQTRVFYWDGAAYGICREKQNEELEIALSEAAFPILEVDIRVIEMMALEKALLKRQALVLHSAFIAYRGRGIVFTAPSGTGKSTQADLWQRYAGARVVNGDRSIIWWNEHKQCYEVCGLPFCGSSQINYNERYPLHAVVFIAQAAQNHVQSFPMIQAVRKLFGEISINQWDSASVEAAFDQIEHLASCVRMVQLECNMEPEAVETLREFIL